MQSRTFLIETPTIVVERGADERIDAYEFELNVARTEWRPFAVTQLLDHDRIALQY